MMPLDATFTFILLDFSESVAKGYRFTLGVWG